MGTYTAIIQQDGDWWIGWIQEVHGVNAQGETREQLLDNLHVTLKDMLEFYREKGLNKLAKPYERVSMTA